MHIGHVRMFFEAKKLAGKNGRLIVILNNDNWLKLKKGYAFMPEAQRKEIILALKPVDDVLLTGHKKNAKDMSVSAEIKIIKPDIFGKGGDRNPGDVPIPGSEVDVCAQIGAEVIYNLGAGGKVESSSWLLNKFLEHELESKRSKIPKKSNKKKRK